MKPIKKHSAAIFALAFVIFIDALGMAILFPLLNSLFTHQAGGILSSYATIEARNFYYSIALALFPIGAFFASPVLGEISDKIGRKKVLMVSLLGAFLSYLLMAFAVYFKSVMLFLIGRLVSGLTAGSQSIAQAAIVDICHPEHKAHYLSIIMGAMSFGWVGGPLIGGFLADSSIVPWFNSGTALSFAAFLSFLNLLVLHFSFRETLQQRKKLAGLHLHKGPIEFIMAFKIKDIRNLSVIYLITQIGWAFYFGFISLFLSEKFGLSAHAIGLFLAFMAVGFVIPSLGLIKISIKYFTLENAAASALGIGGLIFLLTPMATAHDYILWPIGILVGISIGSAFTYQMTLFSNRTHVSEQGRIMGITASIWTVAWVFSSLVGGFIATMNVHLPLILGGVLLLICSAMMYFYSLKTSQ